MFCILWLKVDFFNGRSIFHFSKKTKNRYQPNYFWPCWLITVNLVKSHNFLLIWKFKPKSWVCSFFSIRRYKNRPEMMSLRIVRTQDLINSQNYQSNDWTILSDIISGQFLYRRMLKKLQTQDFGLNFQIYKKLRDLNKLTVITDNLSVNMTKN